jgi:hypothetical protein
VNGNIIKNKSQETQKCENNESLEPTGLSLKVQTLEPPSETHPPESVLSEGCHHHRYEMVSGWLENKSDNDVEEELDKDSEITFPQPESCVNMRSLVESLREENNKVKVNEKKDQSVIQTQGIVLTEDEERMKAKFKLIQQQKTEKEKERQRKLRNASDSKKKSKTKNKTSKLNKKVLMNEETTSHVHSAWEELCGLESRTIEVFKNRVTEEKVTVKKIDKQEERNNKSTLSPDAEGRNRGNKKKELVANQWSSLVAEEENNIKLFKTKVGSKT